MVGSKFDLYLKASGKIKDKEDVQCAILLHVIGEEAMEIYNTFKFATEEDRTKLDVLKSKFEEYVNPRKNTEFARFWFREYKQQEGEIIYQFMTDLKTRAKSCKFGDQHDSMIRDCIVFGVSDTRLKRVSSLWIILSYTGKSGKSLQSDRSEQESTKGIAFIGNEARACGETEIKTNALEETASTTGV